MARRKKIKTLLISSVKGLDTLQPIVSKVSNDPNFNIQLDVYAYSNSSAYNINNRQREKGFLEILSVNDLILIDLENVSSLAYFDIGIARAIGKILVFIADSNFIDDLPSFVRQSVVITYNNNDELERSILDVLLEYKENPQRFKPSNIIDRDTNSQINVDVERLRLRDFENLCFELLSRLGYKQLEWKMKDDYIDAVTTLRKQDPDGFEYDEIWLISFSVNNELFDIAIHDPDYFIERIYRNLFETDMINNALIKYDRSDVPITLLIISRKKENNPKKLYKEISKRDYRFHKRGVPFTMRIRWWDEQNITSLVQNNLPLARKYFSSDALQRSGVRLSYEELYRQYADINDELQKTNLLLISERNRIESLERDAAWKLLSFTAAHRLGNPMDAIDSELSNLKQAIKMGKWDIVDEIIRSIETPIERAKSIISEFRNLSVAHEINPEIVSIDKLSEILRYAARPAIQKNIEVTFDFEKVPDISVDTKKLSDCFGELIRNSMHFLNEENPKIAISVNVVANKDLPNEIDTTKKYIKISFSDNGCGVPIDKKLVIFKPFERSYVHGTGLGLASCDSIIDIHGGKIREIGKPGEGATFEIFLPINND